MYILIRNIYLKECIYPLDNLQISLSLSLCVCVCVCERELQAAGLQVAGVLI